MQKTFQEKLTELANEKFSEQACYNFFGSLNEIEIKKMLEQLSINNFPLLNLEQKNFLVNYLEKILLKIEEIKK
jgi:hypothetical protein